MQLGTADCRADYLLHFLQRSRREALILVGDIIDLEALSKRSDCPANYWPASHTAVLAELVAITARGRRVVDIPGNHDAAMRGLLGQTLAGIEVRLHADYIGHRLLQMFDRNLNALRRRLPLPYMPLSIITTSRLSGALHYSKKQSAFGVFLTCRHAWHS